MSSRIRPHPEHVYEMFAEVAIPKSSTDNSFILQKYPETFDDEEILKSVPQFAYPYHFQNENVVHFSFVLTSSDSKWTFGFVRHAAKSQSCNTCLVLLSSLPWADTFYKLLNFISGLTNKHEPLHLQKFLESLYLLPVPEAGLQLTVTYYVNAKEYEFTAPCPDHHKIPSIPEDRNLTEYFNAVDTSVMIIIFAAMLNERRILMTSKRLSRLTSCIQASNYLIYPMFWQHIFIPVLPTHLLDYLSAPMPFLIGVPTATLSRVKRQELGDVVILDLDAGKVETPFDDLHMLPTEISLRPPNNLLGDSVARTFLKALVMLIGGYRDALSFPSGQKITFNKEAFVASRPLPMQPFLEKMLQLQIFHQFIDGRLHMLNAGEGFNDEFEFELNLYEDRSVHKLKTQYKEWLTGIKKEGTAMLKSVNPAVRLAYRQVRNTSRHVRDAGKLAIRGFKSKIQEKPVRPRSAPSSPTSSPHRMRGSNHLSSNGNSSNTSSITSMKKSTSGFISSTASASESNNAIIFGPNMSRMDQIRELRESKSRTGFHFDDFHVSPSTGSASGISFDAPHDPSVNNWKIDSNFDLLGELSLYIDKCSLGQETSAFHSPFDDTPHASQSPSSTNPFSSPKISSASLSKLPLVQVNTRNDNQSSNDLIKLESPPEDVAAIFDPLLENKSSSSYNNNGNINDLSQNSHDGISSFCSPHLPSASSQRASSIDTMSAAPEVRKYEPFRISGPPKVTLSTSSQSTRNGDYSRRDKNVSSHLALLEEFAFGSSQTSSPFCPQVNCSPNGTSSSSNSKLSTSGFDSNFSLDDTPVPKSISASNHDTEITGISNSRLAPNIQSTNPSKNNWQKFE